MAATTATAPATTAAVRRAFGDLAAFLITFAALATRLFASLPALLIALPVAARADLVAPIADRVADIADLAEDTALFVFRLAVLTRLAVVVILTPRVKAEHPSAAS